MKELYPWQNKQREKLEAAGRDSAYGVIFAGIAVAVSLVVGGVAWIIKTLKEL